MNPTEPRTRCRTLVAGFGRPGMRDLDFGRQVIRYLEGMRWTDEVVVEDLSYAAPLVLHRLQELEPAKVVLVGAAARGFEVPGSIRRFRLDAEPPRSEDVQRSLEESAQGVVDIDHTLAVARHYGALPSETVIIEVEPADCSFGLGFSEDLASSFDAIVALVQDEVGCAREVLADRDLERELTTTVDRPASQSNDAEPSVALHALIGYAREHKDSRVISEHRGRTLATTNPDGSRLEAAGRCRPWGVNLRSGGSAWFDVIPLDGGWWGCVIGDTAGRGVEATATMADLRAAVRAYVVATGCFPRRVIEHLDRLACATGLGVDATLAYLALHPTTGQVRLANAGHCPPLVAQPGRETSFVRNALTGPLGGPSACPRTEAWFTLDGDATIVLYTAGLVERRRESREVGLERLRHAVLAEPAEQLEALCDRLLALGMSGPRADDICLLAVRSATSAKP